MSNSNGWIPVEERLPEEHGWYLVTFRNGTVTVGQYYATSDGPKFDSNIIAWQPLPAPYVKPRRFVVGRSRTTSVSDYLYKRMFSSPGFYVLDNDNDDRPCADRIPTREAAQRIADIYEEAYK